MMERAAPLADLRVLVVEDNYFIAILLEKPVDMTALCRAIATSCS